MSFFAKLFGGGQKKPEQQPVQKKPEGDIQKKIQREKAKAALDKQIKEFDDKEKKLQQKVYTLKQKAKELVADGKQKQARKYLTEATRVNKQIQNVLIHKKALLENTYQLQAADMDAEAVRVLEETKKHLDEHQKNSQKLLDLIEEANLRKREQQMIHERMKDLVEDEDQKQAEDEMLQQIMAQMKRQKQKQGKEIAVKNVGVKVPEQKVQPIKQRDQIEDMLQGL